jgi:Subtilase family
MRAAPTSIIAAAKDGAGIQNVAPGARILSYRVDNNGTSLAMNGGSSFEALNRLETIPTAAVNLSIGYNGNGTVFNALRDPFINQARSGTVLVIGAGNDGASEVSAIASTAAQADVARSVTLIVGAVDSSNVIASFSNRAGVQADRYLVAPGTSDVLVTSLGGTNGATEDRQGTRMPRPL